MSCFISADVVFSQLNDLFSWPNYCCFCTRFNWLSPVHTSVPFHKCEFQDAKRKLIADKKAMLAKAKINSFWFSFFICHYCWKCDKCDKYQQRNVKCVYVWPCMQFVIKPANPYSYNHTVKSFYSDDYDSSHLFLFDV